MSETTAKLDIDEIEKNWNLALADNHSPPSTDPPDLSSLEAQAKNAPRFDSPTAIAAHELRWLCEQAREAERLIGVANRFGAELAVAKTDLELLYAAVAPLCPYGIPEKVREAVGHYVEAAHLLGLLLGKFSSPSERYTRWLSSDAARKDP